MAGPHVRESYNAKARGSTAGGSRKKGKPKKKSQASQSQASVESDPNASIITPKSEEEKDKDRKEKLLQEVCCCDEIYMRLLYSIAPCSLLVRVNRNGRAKRRRDLRNIL